MLTRMRVLTSLYTHVHWAVLRFPHGVASRLQKLSGGNRLVGRIHWLRCAHTAVASAQIGPNPSALWLTEVSTGAVLQARKERQ